LATDKDYRKQGHGSKIVEWGCAEADKEGLELYLDASKAGQPLYEKFGFVAHGDVKDPKAPSMPMLRPAKKAE
jgi:predicted GNAT family N-acyltransferase